MIKTNRVFWPRIFAIVLLMCGLSACASMDKAASQSSISFFHSYEVALKSYERGDVMIARDHIQRMDKTRDDYPQAQQLLKKKVEPARRRLLAYYKRKAEAAEGRKDWFKALSLYEQAASFSPGWRALANKVKAMDLRVRQVRLNRLITRRRSEDAALLAWAMSYTPPKGLEADDISFSRKKEEREDWVDDWASDSYNEAWWYLKKGYPEVAYVEIESHLRLNPDSNKGLRLKKELMEVFPKGLKIPRGGKADRPTSHKQASRSVSADQIKALMKEGKLLQAKADALLYLRRGGKDAESLLKGLQSRIEKEADSDFQKGRIDFREERLPKAIIHWRRAVQLVPDHPDYTKSLRLAEQMQERLSVLRGG